jgi:hypothetical protein
VATAGREASSCAASTGLNRRPLPMGDGRLRGERERRTWWWRRNGGGCKLGVRGGGGGNSYDFEPYRCSDPRAFRPRRPTILRRARGRLPLPPASIDLVKFNCISYRTVHCNKKKHSLQHPTIHFATSNTYWHMFFNFRLRETNSHHNKGIIFPATSDLGLRFSRRSTTSQNQLLKHRKTSYATWKKRL